MGGISRKTVKFAVIYVGLYTSAFHATSENFGGWNYFKSLDRIKISNRSIEVTAKKKHYSSLWLLYIPF